MKPRTVIIQFETYTSLTVKQLRDIDYYVAMLRTMGDDDALVSEKPKANVIRRTSVRRAARAGSKRKR